MDDHPEIPSTPAELIRLAAKARREQADGEDFSPRQRELLEQLLDEDDEELFDAYFHQQLMAHLLELMHDWHQRVAGTLLEEGDAKGAVAWLGDAANLRMMLSLMRTLDVGGRRDNDDSDNESDSDADR